MRWMLLAVATLMGVSVTLSLGFWQLRRASQKEALAAAIAASESQPTLDAMVFLQSSQALDHLHQSVHLRGAWVPEHPVYLDNRQMNAKVGFFVFTPLRLEGSNRVVMVQRGWIPRNFESRETLPAVQTPPGLVEVTGRIALPPSKLYEPGTPGTSSIRQNLDLSQFRLESRLPLDDAWVLVQTGAASEGLLREWPVVNLGVEKHYGYAFQWFALAALIAGLFGWFQVRPLLIVSKDK
jgi:surfeit locus 1 family protein